MQALGGVLAFLLAVFYAYLQVLPQLRNFVLLGALAVLLFLVFAIWYAKRHSSTFFTIIVTDNDHYKDSVLASTNQFFSRLHITRSKAKEFVRVNPAHTDWADSISLATARLGEANEEASEVHLACHAYSLWCVALGMQLQDRLPLILYHFQDGTHYRIWQVSRDIKNRKAVAADQYPFRICRPPEPIQQGSSDNAVGLVLACGSQDPCPSVAKFVAAELPQLPVWVVRLSGGLDPHHTIRWLDAAADCSYALDFLSTSGAKEVYLFGAMPATLGLMTGSAIGPYRRIHLMQYENGSYREAMIAGQRA